MFVSQSISVCLSLCVYVCVRGCVRLCFGVYVCACVCVSAGVRVSRIPDILGIVNLISELFQNSTIGHTTIPYFLEWRDVWGRGLIRNGNI